ncbi:MULTISPECIES: AAA family ATPase [unclassified Microcoleus]|uniref:AAA family ATPase n=2 Tax=Microcoleus TaxID=44471 RepID=UPI002FCEFA7C
MEKVFVHPECPFSPETFSLLAEFSENPSSDFHITHKKDFLKYVEKPVKYILSQVEEQLPDFIKKYINIKREKFCSIIETRKWQSTAYSLAFFCEDVPLVDGAAQLILRFKEQKLTFGLEMKESVFQLMLYIYKQNYRDDFDYIEIIKGYNLSNKHYFSLSSSWKEEGFWDDEHFFYGVNLEEIYDETEADKNLHELLENILIKIPVHLLESKNFKDILFGDIFAGISFESKQILGYSSKNIINKIAQAFTKLFSFFLIGSYYYRHDLPAILDEYLSVYQKEFNPVYQLETISEITGFQTTQLTQWIHAIHRKGQTIIQGPPGTGKTFIAEKLAKHLISGGDGFSDIIQFHPAYTYEDFIEGLRPTTQNGQLTYSIVPGRFLEFCEKAEACEDTCVLIIDEINRANLSQVFGELMYLLDDRQDTGRFITLASGKLFRIPTNVRIIGTMNTADRSIALVDNALRRRFAFIPLSPNYKVLRHYHKTWQTGFPIARLNLLIGILKDINVAINNKHYELGISFFLTKTLAEDIQDIWQMEIEPYLEEYFFDNLEKMDKFLWDKIKSELSN